jgi:alkylation response protein AidB-like acyl-CoA dehydrogenase
MQFIHSEEQQMIRASARLLAGYDSSRLRSALRAPCGYDTQLWQQISGELGWCALAIPEDCGGAGLGWVELCLLQEEQGRRLLASPFFATAALGAAIIRAAPQGAQRTALLQLIAAGRLRVACALTGEDGRPPPQGTSVTLAVRDATLTLSGTSDFVIHAESAERFLVLARDAATAALSVVVIPVQTSGITVTPHVMLDLTRPMARVTFDAVAVLSEQLLGPAGGAAGFVAQGLDLARIALAAEAVGGAEQILEMTTEYVKQRVQFGRPIGSFQALKHRLADMMVQVEAAKSAAWYAASVADEDDAQLGEAAAIAKSYCCDAFYDCAASAIQLHGGVGYTWEHDAHLYFKRARASASLLGSPAWQRERLLRVLGLGEAATPLF